MTLREELVGHSESIYWLAWTRDGRKIASSSYDSTVRIWDQDSGSELAKLRVDSPAFSVAWNADGSRVVTGDYAKREPVWPSRPQLSSCVATLSRILVRMHFERTGEAFAFQPAVAEPVSGRFASLFDQCGAARVVVGGVVEGA